MNSQTPARLTGSASMSFQNPVYVVSCASVVGKKEGEGPLGSKFDLVCEEPMFGEDTWEAAESTMQKEAAALALGKAGLTPGDIRMTFAGVFWLRLPPLPLELPEWESHFMDFSVHAPP